MANDILIVDDEQDIRSLISDVLNDHGIETREAWDGESANTEIQRRVPALVLLDIWLKDTKPFKPDPLSNLIIKFSYKSSK